MTETIEKKLKGLLIDPETESIAEVEIRKGSKCLDDLYKAIGCDTVDCIRAGVVLSGGKRKEDDIWVDDEALLGEPKHFWILPGYAHPIAGRGVILSADDEGDCVSHTLTPLEVEELKRVIQFYHLADEDETDTETADK